MWIYINVKLLGMKWSEIDCFNCDKWTKEISESQGEVTAEKKYLVPNDVTKQNLFWIKERNLMSGVRCIFSYF